MPRAAVPAVRAQEIRRIIYHVVHAIAWESGVDRSNGIT